MIRGRPPTRDTVAILALLGVVGVGWPGRGRFRGGVGAPGGGGGRQGPPLIPTGVTVRPGGGTTPSWLRCRDSMSPPSLCRLAGGRPGEGGGATTQLTADVPQYYICCWCPTAHPILTCYNYPFPCLLLSITCCLSLSLTASISPTTQCHS